MAEDIRFSGLRDKRWGQAISDWVQTPWNWGSAEAWSTCSLGDTRGEVDTDSRSTVVDGTSRGPVGLALANAISDSSSPRRAFQSAAQHCPERRKARQPDDIRYRRNPATFRSESCPQASNTDKSKHHTFHVAVSRPSRRPAHPLHPRISPGRRWMSWQHIIGPNAGSCRPSTSASTPSTRPRSVSSHHGLGHEDGALPSAVAIKSFNDAGCEGDWRPLPGVGHFATSKPGQS